MKVKHLYRSEVVPGGLFAIPDAPQSVMFDLTWMCNQRCRFCYNPAAQQELPFPDLETQLRIVRTLGQWGVEEILYLGGEPTLCQHLDAVLEAGAQFPLRQRLVTNGQRMTLALVRLLARSDVEVGVSFCGAEERSHDYLTQRAGSFRKAVDSVSKLLNAGVRVFLHFSPTTAHEPGELLRFREMIERSFSGQTKALDVNRLLPQGEASSNGRPLLLGPEGWWSVLRDAGRMAEAGWAVHVESVPRCWVRKQAQFDRLSAQQTETILSVLRPCRQTIVQLALDPMGRVKLCPGGAPTADTLPLDKPGEYWRTAPMLQAYRRFDWLPTECVDYATGHLCEEFHDCAGGCRFSGKPGISADDLFAAPRFSTAYGPG